MTIQFICVDANFVVKLINSHCSLFPLKNVFYQMKLAKQLLSTEAQQCLNNALNLPIQFYGDRQLHQQAWEVAQQFNLPAAYDAHYLALAQRFQADFYTGDKRLFNMVHSAC